MHPRALGVVKKMLMEKIRRNPAFYVGLVGTLAAWCMARDPLATTAAQRAELARNFKFVRADLPSVPGGSPRTVRPVAPSMARIQQWCSALTNGVTIADLDGDGLPNDLLYIDNRTEQLMIAPVPGSTKRYAPFQMMALGHDRVTAGPSTTLVGDFNEDGRTDVLVGITGRTPLLFMRTSQKSLTANAFRVEELVPAEEGKKREAWATSCALQADFDGDGHLDLAIGNYFPDWCDIYNPKEERVQEMHNNNGWACNGGGLHIFLWKKPSAECSQQFREIKEFLPEKERRGWALALGAQDLDGDLLPELYCGNDLGPDRMLLNRSTPGNLKFVLVEGEKSVTTPLSFVMGQDKYKGMACEFFDLNFDGIGDIFVSNVACEFALQESHFLWMSQTSGKGLKDGVAPYVQESEKYGVSRGGWGWDAKFESFSNGVRPELLQARGFLKGTTNRWPELQSLATYNSHFLKDPRHWPNFKEGVDIAGGDTNAFYVPDANGTYVDVCREVGLGDAMASRGVATGDVDGDGRVDFAIANMWGPSYYWRNVSTGVGRWMGLRLVRPTTEGKMQVVAGRPPLAGLPAFGAVVDVKLPCGRVLHREVDGGNGHAGHRAPEIHVGLGDLDEHVTTLPVTMRWRKIDGSLAAPVTKELPVGAWTSVVLGKEVAE